jgi:hypothetical protein
MTVTEEQITQLRNRVAHLEGKIEFLYKHLGITFVPESSSGDDPRIIAALKKGNLLEAIKVYRQLHSTSSVTIGVDEARLAVEEIQGRLGI